MVFLDYYQEVGSPSYVFGMLCSSIVIVSGLVWMVTVGARSNDKFIFAPGPKHQSKVFHVAVLLWRIVAFSLSIKTLVDGLSNATNKVTEMPLKVTGIHMPPTPGISFDFITVNTHWQWNLVYFTWWNFFLITFYFFISLMVSALRIFKSDSVPVIQKGADGVHRRVAGPCKHERSAIVTALLHTQQHAAEIALPTAIFVTFFVWSYLIPSSPYQLFGSYIEFLPVLKPIFGARIPAALMMNPDGYVDFTATYGAVMMHGMNSVMLLIEFFIAGYRFNPNHFFMPLVWGSVYMIFTLIMNAKYGMVCYAVMRTDLDEFIFFYGTTFMGTAMNYWALSFTSTYKDHWNPRVVIAFLCKPSDNDEVDELAEEPATGEKKVYIVSDSNPGPHTIPC